MADPTHVLHITLDTGDRRHSPRNEVTPAAITVVEQMLAEALSLGTADIRPGYRLSAAASGGTLDASVIRDGHGTLVTVGVVRRSRASPRVWALMGGVGFHPPAPWCAVRLHHALRSDPEAARWLGDFERCLAWAWIGMRGDTP